jgi:anaerobilin synthase
MFDLRLLPDEPLLKFNRQVPVFNWLYPLSREPELIEDRSLPYKRRTAAAARRRAIYIHIPFCETICTFCPFQRDRYKGPPELSEYVEALLGEFELKRAYIGRPCVDAIFIGGGTPSLLTAAQVRTVGDAIGKHFDLAPQGEFSMECEVKSISPEKLRAMREIGVNRVSFGVQTLLPEYRALFSLDATREQIVRAAGLLNEAFPYTNVDLMYGFAGQSLDQVMHDLAEIMRLQTTTIDAYPINNLSIHRSLHRAFARSGLDLLPATSRLGYRVNIDRCLRSRGYRPINGYSYAKAVDTSPGTNNVVQHSPKFIYHDILYGYEDDEIIGYGSSASSRIANTNLFNFSNRGAYVREILVGKALPHMVCTPAPAEERGVVTFPYRGDLQNQRINWDAVPEATLSSLRAAVSAGLVHDAAGRYEVSQLGWLFYVNLMYFLMPEQGRQWISDNIDLQQQRGRDCEDTRLVPTAEFDHIDSEARLAVCS